jgi:hypothetical protein
MDFRKLTTSLLAATTLLASTLPANAGPFDGVSSGVFKPATSGGSVGNVVPDNSPTPVGNGEVQGLGDHQSWVDPKVLAKDARTLCSDVGLGNNTHSSASKIALATSTSTRSSSAKTHNNGGGGGVSVLGIVGVNGSGSSKGSENNSNSKDTRNNSNEERSSNSSTVVQGRNCDAFVNSAAARDMNYQDNLTRRYEIKTGRRGQQVNQLLEDKSNQK